MRRIATTLALALCLLCCGPKPEPAPSGEPIELPTFADTCHDQWAEGLLLSFPTYGTAISVMPTGTAVWPSANDGSSIVPVRWPTGFTGLRLTGGEVAVLDRAGNLVVTTGRKYSLRGGWLLEVPGLETVAHVAGFVACGDAGSVVAK